MRRELSEAHAQSTQQALAALAQEKDDAFSEARQTWNREKSSFKERVCESKLRPLPYVLISSCPQIVYLERKLVEIQQSNSLSLEETREQAEKQIANLRYWTREAPLKFPLLTVWCAP